MGKSVVRILSAHTPRLLRKQNVVGVGIGAKNSEFDPKAPPAVVVLVKKKLPVDEIPTGDLVPKSIGGILTDVVEVGELQLLAQRTARVRPAVPGVSIGHYKVTAGTLGALVKDKTTGQLLVLSNNHVLANITDGRDGRAEPGDPILQPGRYDGGSAQDVIARLERFIPILRTSGPPDCPIAQGVERAVNKALEFFRPSYSIRLLKTHQAANMVDAALAKPISDDVVAPKILGIGRIEGVAEPYVGMKVVKSGRTTEVTEGTIRVINATLKVSMSDVGEALFSQQIVATAMAEGGDSGSLVLTPDRKAVGLLSAGSDSATVMSHIGNVLELLNVELV